MNRYSLDDFNHDIDALSAQATPSGPREFATRIITLAFARSATSADAMLRAAALWSAFAILINEADGLARELASPRPRIHPETLRHALYLVCVEQRPPRSPSLAEVIRIARTLGEGPESIAC